MRIRRWAQGKHPCYNPLLTEQLAAFITPSNAVIAGGIRVGIAKDETSTSSRFNWKALCGGPALDDCISKRQNNLTFLRLAAAYLVLVGHSWTLTLGLGHHDPFSELIRPNMPWHLGLPGIAVSMFFLFSGLLITRSYFQRNNLFHFLEARILRLYPALIVCVVICVFGIGLAQTTWSVDRFIAHKATENYLLHNTSLVFNIKFRLPGLFVDQPFKGVNGSLWTLPYEAWMYLCAAVLGVLTIFRRRWLFNLFFLTTFLLYGLDMGYPGLTGTKFERLGIFFLMGAFAYINARKVRLNPALMAFFMAIAWLTADSPIYAVTGSAALAYTMLVIGFSPWIRLPNMDSIGDFSYGTYLYAFPVQQTLIHQLESPKPWEICLLALFIVTPVAMASWYGVERPMLRFKGRLSRKLDPRVWQRATRERAKGGCPEPAE